METSLNKRSKEGGTVRCKVKRSGERVVFCGECRAPLKKHYYFHQCDVWKREIYCYECLSRKRCKRCNKPKNWVVRKNPGFDGLFS